MEEKGFKIFKSYAKTLARMSDEARGRLLKLVCDWVFAENPADRSLVELQVPDSMCAIFDIITERARKDIERSERISETNRRNIRRRWSVKSSQGDTTEYDRIRPNTKIRIVSEKRPLCPLILLPLMFPLQPLL